MVPRTAGADLTVPPCSSSTPTALIAGKPAGPEDAACCGADWPGAPGEGGQADQEDRDRGPRHRGRAPARGGQRRRGPGRGEAGHGRPVPRRARRDAGGRRGGRARALVDDGDEQASRRWGQHRRRRRTQQVALPTALGWKCAKASTMPLAPLPPSPRHRVSMATLGAGSGGASARPSRPALRASWAARMASLKAGWSRSSATCLTVRGARVQPPTLARTSTWRRRHRFAAGAREG